MTKRILVIGGGASGMMAAIAAACGGARVTILERMQRVGKKLLATGNGRCNLSNREPTAEHYHGAARFAAEVIAQLDAEATRALFEDLGLALRAEPDGKIYPATDQATAVLDLMRTRTGTARRRDAMRDGGPADFQRRREVGLLDGRWPDLLGRARDRRRGREVLAQPGFQRRGIQNRRSARPSCD